MRPALVSSDDPCADALSPPAPLPPLLRGGSIVTSGLGTVCGVVNGFGSPIDPALPTGPSLRALVTDGIREPGPSVRSPARGLLSARFAPGVPSGSGPALPTEGLALPLPDLARVDRRGGCGVWIDWRRYG